MLISDGGGGGNPYQIKVNSVSGGGEEQSMGYQEIMQLLHGLKPADMTAAAASFEKLGNTLDAITGKLRDQGSQLADSWSGEAAAKAMQKFQQLHDQAAQLAAQAHTTSGTMKWMGNDVMPKFQSLPSPQVMGKSEADGAMGSAAGPGGTLVGMGLGAMGIGPDGQAKADNAAREYMKSFNGYMTQANSQLPPSTAGPGIASKGSLGTKPGGASGGSGGGLGPASAYGGVGGTNTPGGGAGAGSPYAPSGSGHVNLSHLANGGGGSSNASLQGYAPPSSGTGAGSPFGGSGGAGGGGASPFGGMGVVPGAGAGVRSGAGGEDGVPGEEGMAGEKGLGEDALRAGKTGLPGEEGVPGEEGLGANGAAGDAAGVGGDAAGASGAAGAEGAAGEATGADAAGAAGAEAGEAGGMNAMPMGGMGGGGQSDQERQRQAWMNEDKDIWGVPGEDIGPVIG